MTHFDGIYDIAAEGHGIVTAAQAQEAGVAPSELNRWCADGRLLRRGRAKDAQRGHRPVARCQVSLLLLYYLCLYWIQRW